jgi:hypothetical protein
MSWGVSWSSVPTKSRSITRGYNFTAVNGYFGRGLTRMSVGDSSIKSARVGGIPLYFYVNVEQVAPNAPPSAGFSAADPDHGSAVISI